MKVERGRSFTLNNLSDKEMKNLEVLELIRKSGTISRADISKITNINLVSTYNYTKSYIDSNIISEKGFDVSTGGRKPELVELSAKNYIIGLDINKTSVRGALVDLSPNIIKKSSMSLNGKDMAGAIKAVVDDLSASLENKVNSVRAIGVAISDEYPEKIEKIIESLSANFFVGTNASCASCAERYLNPKAGADNILYIFSSLGRGVMIKKEEFFEESYSEETKYLRPWDNSLGLIDRTRQEISRGVGTMVVDLVKADPERITEDIIIEAAKCDDEVALGIIQSSAASLGIRVSYLVNLFSPAAVIIGGGLENAGELMINGIKRALDKLIVKKLAGSVTVTPAVMGEDAVSVGAASLAIREIFLRA